MNDPVPPEAPRTTTLRRWLPTCGGSQSRHAKAVNVTRGNAAAASCVKQLGFLATGTISGLK